MKMATSGPSSKLLLVSTMALLSGESTLAFGPRLNTPIIGNLPAKHVATRVFASTLPNQEAKANGVAARQSVENVSKKSGIEALERLLSRQQSEIEETKRLIELYESVGQGSNSTIDSFNAEGEKSDLLSAAGAVFKGFDYGFRSRSEGPTFEDLKGGNAAFIGYGPPANLLTLGSQQFMRNTKAMMNEYEDEADISLSKEQVAMQQKLKQLTLNSTAIWERELKDGPIEAPLLIKIPYLALCFLLDTVFEGRYTPSRFFLLETVARMPYFSYIAMLHLYETLGFWRRSADMKRIHFAEELNEFRHLLIMESLGGDQRWWVRFMAQHSALAYYIGLCMLFWISPSLSYKFSELLETHAVNTYSQFLDENEELLKELPPSLAAVDYYALGASDPYYAEFQTTAISQNKEIRRPGLNMESMYDVFSAIRDDEGDHVGTMEACLDPTVAKLSPSLERKVLTGIATAAAVAIFMNTGGDLGIGADIADSLDLGDLTDMVSEDGAGGFLSTLDSTIDALVAGATGLATQMGSDGVDGEEVSVVEGIMPELQNFLAELAELLSRFI